MCVFTVSPLLAPNAAGIVMPRAPPSARLSISGILGSSINGASSGRGKSGASSSREVLVACLAALTCVGTGVGMVLGLAYLLYPGGYACETEKGVSYGSGGWAALVTVAATAPIWARTASAASFAARAWPGHETSTERATRRNGWLKGATALMGGQTGASSSSGTPAGWLAIVQGDSSWAHARQARGMSQGQALRSAAQTLLLWHWSQPVAYMLVLEAYKCYHGFVDAGGVGYLGVLALLVAAREALYVLSTLVALLCCPSFLLLDPAEAWREADGFVQKMLRLAAYVIAPHNYVMLCLSNRFESAGRIVRRTLHACPYRPWRCIG